MAIGFMVEYTATCSSLSGMWESGPDHVVYPDFDTDIVLTGEPVGDTPTERMPPAILPCGEPSK